MKRNLNVIPRLIRVDCSAVETQPKNGKDFKLKELQELVGGNIEILHVGRDTIMVVDEEGRLKGKEFNFFASSLYWEVFGYNGSNHLVGDVLICPARMVK